MNHREVTQYQADHVGVIQGADIDFHVPSELPCSECEGMVDLSAEITVSVTERDGTQSETRMTEANARQLIGGMGILPPPVMCDRHGEIEV